MIEQLLNGLVASERTRDVISDVTANISLFILKVRKDDIPGEYKPFVEILLGYFEKSGGGVLDDEILSSILTRTSLAEDKKVFIFKLFSEFKRIHITHDKYKFYIERFNSAMESKWLVDMQTKAMIALEKGYTDNKSHLIYDGVEGARLLLGKMVFENPYATNSTDYPSGDIRRDAVAIIDEYERAKKGVKNKNTVLTGFREIDSCFDGFRRGDFILVGAYTGEGKSMFFTNVCHNMCVVQNKPGVIFTAETSRSVYRRRILTRHSCHPGVGTPDGIHSKKLKSGSLGIREEELFLKIVADFTDNPNYGYLNIIQISRGATIRDVMLQAERINRLVPIEYIVIDYLELLSPVRHRTSRREEIEEMMANAKEFSLSFNNGEGIALLGAHQLKQTARDNVEATDAKFYTIRDFAHTSEAGKSVDGALMLLRTEELKAAHEIAAKIVKARDADTPPMFKLYENFSVSYLGDLI